jgi:glycosyltransferase involved in cell wall biosynthesis
MQDTLLEFPTFAEPAPAPPAPGNAGSSPRLKVLICAYACSPARGSEYGVGWGWVEAISQYHDLWVLTGAHTRDEVEAELARRSELKDRINFHFIPRTRYLWAERFWPPAYLLTYQHQWLNAAFKAGKKLHQEVHFDIVHQLTYVGFRVPGHLWKLDAPFVWGPIGGLEQTTWSLLPSLGFFGCIHFAARNLINEWDRRIAVAPRRAFRRAKGGIIAATTGIQREIRRFYHCESAVLSEIGLPPITRNEPPHRLPNQPLSLLWCGLLQPRKALPFLFAALRQLPPSIHWKLTVLGDGPSSAKWQRMARRLGIADRCTWLGHIPREAVLQQMHAAHALVITSVYDLTSTVLVEALANGLPVICPDHCGFTDAITPNCGIRVPATSRQSIVNGLRDALLRIDDESLRMHLAEGALARSLHFSWDRKASLVSEIYRIKAAPRATAPATPRAASASA